MFFNDVKGKCKYKVRVTLENLSVKEYNNVDVTNFFSNAITVLFDDGSGVVYPMDTVSKVEVYPTR